MGGVPRLAMLCAALVRQARESLGLK